MYKLLPLLLALMYRGSAARQQQSGDGEHTGRLLTGPVNLVCHNVIERCVACQPLNLGAAADGVNVEFHVGVPVPLDWL